MDESLRKTIDYVYNDPAMRESRLSSLRVAATKKIEWWISLLEAMRIKLGNHRVGNFTNLENDVSFACEVTIAPRHVDLSSARCRGIFQGSSVVLRGFVSIVAPYGYVSEFCVKHDSSKELPVFIDLAPDANEEVQSVAQVMTEVFQTCGLTVLSRAEVQSQVAVETDCSDGEHATLFGCLFSDILSP